MNLLFLTPRLPFPPNRGGEITVFNFIKRLSKRHEVSLVSLYSEPGELQYRDNLASYCKRIELVPRRGKFAAVILGEMVLRGKSYGMARHYSVDFASRCARVLSEEAIDLVQAETFYVSQYVTKPRAVSVVLDMHNVTWLVWERMARMVRWPLRPLVALEARRQRRDELEMCRDADACIAVSGADRDLLISTVGVPLRTYVVTPGIDTDALQPQTERPKGARLVFVGSMEYYPNVDAMLYFCDAILPLVARAFPEVELTIVGKPARAIRRLGSRANVILAGLVADVRPFVWDAAVSIAPLRIAGGIRIKILEAMALGSAIVSTSIGCEGLGLEDGGELLIGDTPEAFAAAVVQLLRDGELRSRLGKRARQTAVQRFSWDTAVHELEKIYHSVVGEGSEVRRLR